MASVEEKLAGAVQAAPPVQPDGGEAAVEHMRGSSLLLAGRFVAFGLEFAAQVLLVRYLSKSDFGAFSYALSIVVLLKSIAILEMPNTLARFIPVYREQRAYGKLTGSVALAVGVVAALGALMVVLVEVATHQQAVTLTEDSQAILLLAALALLIPMEGLDAVLTAVLATLAGAKEIAFRQVFAPALKLAVVVALIWLGSGVTFLATGYVLASAISLAIYALLLFKHAGGCYTDRQIVRAIRFPAREIFGFAFPLLAATVVWLLMESSDAALLGYIQNSEAVASFRAVLPVPKTLAILTLTFGVLYTPLASRLYARRQHDGLANLYRRSALWMTVLSFPIFALAFSFARSTTGQLYGARYADSSAIMMLLALGYYCFAVTGFNGMTLKIHRKLRYAVGVDIAAAVINIGVNLALIPHWGPLGAAVGTCGTMIVHNGLKQYGLWRYLKVNLFEPDVTATYIAVAVLAIVLLVVQSIMSINLIEAVLITGLATLILFWIARQSLDVNGTFPEVGRWAAAFGIRSRGADDDR